MSYKKKSEFTWSFAMVVQYLGEIIGYAGIACVLVLFTILVAPLFTSYMAKKNPRH